MLVGFVVCVSILMAQIGKAIVANDMQEQIERYRTEADEHERLYGIRGGDLSMSSARFLSEAE